MSLTEAINLALLTSAFPWLMFLCRHMGFIRAFLAGMRLRCAYSGLVFRKVRNLEYNKIEKINLLFHLNRLQDYQ